MSNRDAGNISAALAAANIESWADERMPTKTWKEYWLYAVRTQEVQKDYDYSGKWLLFISLSSIDDAWEKVRNATVNGTLGSASKVATMRNNPNATSKDVKVICVYTNDYRDMGDVRRVLIELRKLGFEQAIYYKEDDATHSRLYTGKGRSASLYGSMNGEQIFRRREPIKQTENGEQ
jgi:hypothetical protein